MDFSEEIFYQFSPFLINEYCYCQKLFWLHFNKIRLFEDNEQIKIGKIEHDSKEGESTNEWIKYDSIRDGVLIEYTKKKACYKGKELQLLLYMYRSKAKIGELRDTNTDKIYKQIILDEEKMEELKNILVKMSEISAYRFPPEVIQTKKCLKCSFFEYCWVG